MTMVAMNGPRPDPTPTADFLWRDRQDWYNDAWCKGLAEREHVFFPESGGNTKEAKVLCSNCKVRAECLEYALSHKEPFGVWGGMTPKERNKLLKGRNDG